MFDITPSELLTIAVVALIVLGPKRLVEMSRRAGEFAGRFRRYADEFRSGLEKEVDQATAPFREAGTTLAAAGKELMETPEGELRWVDRPPDKPVSPGGPGEVPEDHEAGEAPEDQEDEEDGTEPDLEEEPRGDRDEPDGAA